MAVEDVVCCIRVLLPARRTAGLMALGVGLLLAVHVAFQCANFLWRPMPVLIMDLFDVDEEESVPTWYASSSLLFAAGLLAVVAARKRSERDRWSLHWWGLAAGFAFLSLDEVAGFHEAINTVIPYSWTIPALVGSLGVALVYAGFLWGLPRRTAVRTLVAGALYLAGALGVELATDPLFDAYGSENLAYNLINGVEEGLEMAGVVVFVHALLDYMARLDGEEGAASAG